MIQHRGTVTASNERDLGNGMPQHDDEPAKRKGALNQNGPARQIGPFFKSPPTSDLASCRALTRFQESSFLEPRSMFDLVLNRVLPSDPDFLRGPTARPI